MKINQRLSLLVLVILISACEEKLTPITSCQSTDQIQVICQFKNPEDLELLPDRRTLLVSQMGDMEGTKTGNLVSYHTVTGALNTLFPLNQTGPSANGIWGDKRCPGVPTQDHFSPHGISVKRRHDGRWQLAVVNHGRGETVEMFEIKSTQGGKFRLLWRGCVVPPAGTYLNDVAVMRNGGFVASHMFERNSPVIFGLRTGLWKSQLGLDTGYVFEWLPDDPDNFRVLAGSRGPFINGIQISRDDSTVFANVYAGNEIRKLDRLSGELKASMPARQVDNTSWDDQGFLLAASHTGGALDQMDCMKQPGATCGFEFTILRINPETLEAKAVFKHSGAPMGAATIARQVGKFIYLGSFSGDRIIKTPYNIE